MKLYELVGVKKYYDTDVEAALQSMGSSGYKEEGRGTFGVTLSKSKSGVVKFWGQDSSYDDYINYIAANPSIYFPKLLSKPKTLSSFFLRPKDFPDKIRYVRMEKLNPMKKYEDADIVADIFSELSGIHSESKLEEYIKKIHEPYSEAEFKRFKTMVHDVPDFCRECFKMLRVVLKGGNQLDLHSGNMMLRANNQLVITDPVYNHSDYYKAEKIGNALYRIRNKREDDEDDKIETVRGKTPKKTGESK